MSAQEPKPDAPTPELETRANGIANLASNTHGPLGWNVVRDYALIDLRAAHQAGREEAFEEAAKIVHLARCNVPKRDHREPCPACTSLDQAETAIRARGQR